MEVHRLNREQSIILVARHTPICKTYHGTLGVKGNRFNVACLSRAKTVHGPTISDELQVGVRIHVESFVLKSLNSELAYLLLTNKEGIISA